MSDIGADVLAKWRVVPEDVASLPVFAFGSRGGFVCIYIYIHIYIYIYISRYNRRYVTPQKGKKSQQE